MARCAADYEQTEMNANRSATAVLIPIEILCMS
jgi:hypothetical protein